MLLSIAWKNIWRNKVRSLIVISSVVLGLWAGAFIMSYSFGMMEQRLEDAIESEISHLQIHHPDYQTDNDPKFNIQSSDKIVASLEKDDRIKSFSDRLLVMGMVNSPTTASGGKVFGIVPERENATTGIAKIVVDGEYLEANDRNKVIIGKKLAEKLKVKVRSKIVLTFQDENKDIVAGAFRIKGIYDSHNSSLEEMNIYTTSNSLSKLLGDTAPHEIAILLNNADQLSGIQEELVKTNSALTVESWKDLSPDLSMMIETMDQSMTIFLMIILIALSFGIINTMLMAVLERVKEIGMLMAIGMTRTRLFGMISFETIFMVMIAAPIGLLLAYTTITYLGTYGLDLSALYAEGYEQFGFKSIIYPYLKPEYYGRIIILVLITAVLSSIYPAITALRLNPVEAIRKL